MPGPCVVPCIASCAVISSECRSSASSMFECRYDWDLAEAVGAQQQSVLHVAANMDDGGRMAGLLLGHGACPQAAALWASLQDAQGRTPADVAFRCVPGPYTVACDPTSGSPGPQLQMITLKWLL